MVQPSRTQTSLDGLLTLEVFDDDDLIGFKNQAWHTHGDLLVPGYGSAAAEARAAFFDSVVGDGESICIYPKRQAAHRCSITNDVALEIVLAGGEPMTVRLWSGKHVGSTTNA